MFSVVIPLYNKEKYILRAVESVLAQTYQDFELIVVDDGSTDTSLDTIKNILDPRLKIIKQHNQGVSAARNTGIKNSTQNWIAFLDADDAWLNEHLSELYKLIKFYSEVGMVSTRIREVLDSNEVLDLTPVKKGCFRRINYFHEASKYISIINSSTVAIKKEVFDQLGGFIAIKAGEDLECWARVALNYPVAISDKITCYYFRDTGGVMQSLAANKQPSTPVLRLADISPSVNMLIQKNEVNPSILKNKSIRRYINSRLFNGVKSNLFKSDYLNTKTLSSLALPQLNILYTSLLIFNYIPTFLLKVGINSLQFLRKNLGHN